MHATSRYRLTGIIGNILEHYDNALFALLAPFISPLFFNNHDPLTALILTFGMLPLGFLTRPLGSLFFGWVGDHFGRKHALFCSLLGMTVVTIGMGCLPIYSQVGAKAPLLLALGRMLQNFCAAGESIGGAIFVLEHTSTIKRSFVSSLYDASSIGGILIASILVTYFSSQGFIKEGWRILFWIGGLTAILGVFLRLKSQDGSEFIISLKEKRKSLFKILNENKRPFISIILASGFSYTTYSLAFTLMNGFVPLVTSLSSTESMGINTFLLVIDMLLLPFFGYLANKLGKEKVMLAGAFCSVIGAIPLFYFLNNSSLITVVIIRALIMTSGVAFSAPYHAWTLEKIEPQYRYTILSLGFALGTQIIGAPASAICLWLYQKMGWALAPSFYLLTTGVLATFAVLQLIQKKEPILLATMEK